MNTTPKISVIIPIYNTEKYLRECLDSVVNQTLRDIEIICVDESTDESLQILKEYEAKDKRIKVLSQARTDPGTARNIAMSMATGEYLSFLDSDDYFELTMLEQMYECAKSRNADMIICDMKIYDEESGSSYSVNWHIRKEALPIKSVFSFCDIESNSFRCIVSYVWDKLIKRDIVVENGLLFQALPVYEDAVFVYEAMMSAKAITILDEYLVYKRKRSSKDSGTDFRYKHIDCVYSVISGMQEYLKSKGVYDCYKRDLICYAIHLMDHVYMEDTSDIAVKNDMRDKLNNWLDEFDIAGHEPGYYYELSLYQRLLKKIRTKKTYIEFARLQYELRGR